MQRSANDLGTQQGYAALAARLLSVSRSTIRVLIADDDDLYVAALTAALESDGRIEVVGCARNGKDAVESAAWLRPDVVLMDVHMPVMDGIEATPLVRRSAPGSQVVVLTASTSTVDATQAREAGAVRFLRKGLDFETVAEAVLGEACRVVPLRPARNGSDGRTTGVPDELLRPGA